MIHKYYKNFNKLSIFQQVSWMNLTSTIILEKQRCILYKVKVKCEIQRIDHQCNKARKSSSLFTNDDQEEPRSISRKNLDSDILK